MFARSFYSVVLSALLVTASAATARPLLAQLLMETFTGTDGSQPSGWVSTPVATAWDITDNEYSSDKGSVGLGLTNVGNTAGWSGNYIVTGELRSRSSGADFGLLGRVASTDTFYGLRVDTRFFPEGATASLVKTVNGVDQTLGSPSTPINFDNAPPLTRFFRLEFKANTIIGTIDDDADFSSPLAALSFVDNESPILSGGVGFGTFDIVSPPIITADNIKVVPEPSSAILISLLVIGAVTMRWH